MLLKEDTSVSPKIKLKYFSLSLMIVTIVHFSQHHQHQKGKPCDFQFWLLGALGASVCQMLKEVLRILSEDKRPFT